MNIKTSKKLQFLGAFAVVLSSGLSFASENCYLTMMLKPEFYYIASPHVVKTDHVQVVATVLKTGAFPVYQTAISDEKRAAGLTNPQHSLGQLSQISFDLPNVPGLTSEITKAEQEGYALYINFSWLSDNCAKFEDFSWHGNSSAGFNYEPKTMSYKLHAMKHVSKAE